MNAKPTQHTFKMLKSKEWGIYYRGDVNEQVPSSGLAVAVRKADGTYTDVVVDRVLSRGEGWALCSLRRNRAANNTASPSASRWNGRPRERRTGCYCGSVEGRTKPTDCRQCRYDAE